jgi:hypothetical protein
MGHPLEYVLTRFRCPVLSARISQGECAKRFVRQNLKRCFGGHVTDALATPLDKRCNACPVGRHRAERIAAQAPLLARETGCQPVECRRALVEAEGSLSAAAAWLQRSKEERRRRR